MADTKLSALTELDATPANDDEVYIRDVSEAAAAESKRITIANLIAAVSSRTIATGSYTGNTTARQITTGFKCSLVIIETTNGSPGDQASWLIPNMTIRGSSSPQIDDQLSSAWLHATDGFSVSNGNTHNNSGSTYYYWAISE